MAHIQRRRKKKHTTRNDDIQAKQQLEKKSI